MADKTINQLNEDSSPTSDDFFPTWDVGTGATKKVTLANLQAFLRTNYAFWEILSSTTLGASADTITCSSFTARKNLMIIIYCVATGGTIRAAMQFNSDSGTNYARRFSNNGAADSTSTSASGIQLDQGAANGQLLALLQVGNTSSVEKPVSGPCIQSGSSGAANAPVRAENAAKWTNSTNQITTVAISNSGTGDYASGSIMIVLGHD